MGIFAGIVLILQFLQLCLALSKIGSSSCSILTKGMEILSDGMWERGLKDDGAEYFRLLLRSV